MQLLSRGIARRHTGVTQTNSASSRSHCVVTATLESRLVEDGVTSFRTSRLHLVDLAGGPLPLAAGCASQLREASAIRALLSSPARAQCIMLLLPTHGCHLSGSEQQRAANTEGQQLKEVLANSALLSSSARAVWKIQCKSQYET